MNTESFRILNLWQTAITFPIIPNISMGFAVNYLASLHNVCVTTKPQGDLTPCTYCINSPGRLCLWEILPCR